MTTTTTPPPSREPAPPPDAAAAATPAPAPRRIASHALFDGSAEVLIEHHGAVYRLRQTALGKLILTK